MKQYTIGSAKWHRQKETQKKQRQAENSFSPRKLYRGLTVPYSNKPGRKFLKAREA